MITTENIITAINGIIGTNFPDIEIQGADIEEGFSRPSFFVEILGNDTSSLMSNFKEKKLSIRIYYFPSDMHKYRLELLEVQDKLDNLFFQKLQVDADFFIPIDEVESEEVDGVLQFSFELNYVLTVEDTEEIELMDTLGFDITKLITKG